MRRQDYKKLVDEEGVELQSVFLEPPNTASVSYQLAHETVLKLELRGDYATASEVLAVALAEEAQRINQKALGELDLSQHPLEFKGVMTSMAQQQAHFSKLRLPQDAYEDPSTDLARCFAGLNGRVRRETMPVPSDALSAIASRWHLAYDVVLQLWRDFAACSGGKFTLTLGRARGSLLAGLPEDLHRSVWAFALMDDAAAQLMDDGDGGAAGLNFEEYLVFRCFTSVETLEEQFRFLWRLFDRDGDGKLGRKDLATALQLRQAQLGWDDVILGR